MNLFLFLALWSLAVWLLYLGRALWAWVLPLALGLLVWYVRAGGMTPGLWVSSFVYGTFLLTFLVPPIRRLLVTRRLMPSLAPLFPTLGEEERDVLEAGTIGWNGELLGGAPDWGKLLQLEVPELELSDLQVDAKLAGGGHVGSDEELAPIGGRSYLVEAARRLFAAEVERGGKPVVASAIGEIYLAAEAQSVAEGEREGEVGPASRGTTVFRRAELLAHPYARTEREAVADENLEDLDAALFRHLGHFASNFTRASLLGWSHGRLAASPVEGGAERYFEHFTRMSAAFAVCADATTIGLGGALGNRERLEARLADALAWLYLGTAALKRFTDEGRRERDEPLASWAVEHSLFRVQEALFALLDNLPGRRTAWVLRWKLFPFYSRFKAPGDVLEARVAQLLRDEG